MLNKIIYYSLHNRLVVLICSLLLMIAGTYTAFHTDVDVFPDLNAPTVVIMTEANGMAPEEVERLVTFPVETAVNGAMDVRRVRSSSTTGFSVVWVELPRPPDCFRKAGGCRGEPAGECREADARPSIFHLRGNDDYRADGR